MPGLTPNANPETAAIVGGNFPTDDETTFAANAEAEDAKAEELEALAETVDNESRATDENLQGASGDAAQESLGKSSEELREQAAEHRRIAETMRAGGTNVATTKANINAIDAQYHIDLQNLMMSAQVQAMPPEMVQAEKTRLMTQAQ